MAVYIDEIYIKSLSSWLEPISSDGPSGVDLEYDGRYTSLLNDVKPPAATYDQSEPDDDRNWRELKQKSEELLAETRSLDLASVYTQVLMRQEQTPALGLMKGLYLILEYASNFWDSAYPSLDAADDDPHHFRYNTLGNLGDWKSVVLPLKKDIISLSIGLGDYTLHDIVSLDAGEDIPDKQALVGLTEEELKAILKLKSDFKVCLQLAEDIKKTLGERTGETFNGFDKFLLPCLRQGAEIHPSVSVASSQANAGLTDNGPVSKKVNQQAQVGSKKLSIQNRDDVEKAFELICDYYIKHEPSSPVPLLLQRAKKLVKQDFRAILDELRLGGSSDVEQIFGRLDE